MLGVLAIYVVVTFALEMSGCPRWVHSLAFFRLQCICVPCSILPWILCGLSLMSVHFKGFSPGTPVISSSQKPAPANSNSTRVGPAWKPKSRYFNFTRKKLQSWPLAVGTPSLLRAKTHDFFTFQKNTNRSRKKHPFPWKRWTKMKLFWRLDRMRLKMKKVTRKSLDSCVGTERDCWKIVIIGKK